MIKKNDIIELEIIDISHECSGIGKYEGMAIFVPNTAIGDKINAKILKVNKSYAFAKIENIITPSKNRVENDCLMYNQCGGCSLRHITYEEELKIKKNWVYENLKRIGSIDAKDLNIIPSQNIDHYRNKAQYPVSQCENNVIAGFYANRSHRVVDCTSCKLQPDFFEDITKTILNFMEENNISAYNEETGKGLIRHIYLRYAKSTGEVMICIVATKSEIPSSDKFVQTLLKLPYNIVSIVINVNSKNTNVILGNKVKILHGKDGITDTLCNISVDISSQAFYQVNKDMAEILYNKAFEMAQFNGTENVIELYCGAGTISLAMADKVKHIIAVEIIPAAIENAKINAHKNDINNVEFICDDAAGTAFKLAKSNEKCDIIVIDPPRKGCDVAVLESIAKILPQKIVYISCNSATLARDIKILSEFGYHLDKATVVDLFPRTAHCEVVCLLQRIER